MTEPDLPTVRDHLAALQDRICAALETEDGEARFREDAASSDAGGLARTRILDDGRVFEHAAVNFTAARGQGLPAAATERRPELAGASFEAVSLSLIVHPGNPYVPTSHANLRFFLAKPESDPAVWWFGGGFDLTPCYGFEEDAVHWHRTARAACEPLGPDTYAALKKACDEYFFLPHRGETRGIGGLFFDDLAEGGFERCFRFVRSVGEHYLPAYLPIVRRRRDLPFGARERDFQLYRRGRYVEFNLVYDRGTRYGLQSGRRIESVLASLPPLARWRYDFRPEPGSPEARLSEEFLKPRDWLLGAGSEVVLADGGSARLRPVRPDDTPRLRELFSRLSRESRYLRFFSPSSGFLESFVERSVHVDQQGRAGLVVEVDGVVVALGSYERCAGTDDAEVAFAVADAHQGRGIGTLLVEHLAAIARENGIRRFVADVLGVNQRMLEVFRNVGFDVARRLDDAIIHVSFPIEPTSTLFRAIAERRERATAAR